jgi:23S rRNA pseudouridine1911/1915/1917 synthase
VTRVRVRLAVRSEEAGMRLDRLLVARVAGVGRKRARELFAAGRVTLASRPARPGASAVVGDEIEVELDEEHAVADPEMELDVRLELETVLVVCKPAGVPSAPLRAGERGTLANCVVARYPETQGIGHKPREPGLLHRLDTETSGLLIVARSEAAFAALNAGLGSERLVKRYLAVVEAELEPSGTIDWPLAPDPRRRGRVAAFPTPPRGYFREAITRYRVVERHGDRTLVELDVGRAFRHQVRAHLAALGAPLLGDQLYGGAPFPGSGSRHALHASYVAWAGDGTVPSFRVEATLPDDLRALLGG